MESLHERSPEKSPEERGERARARPLGPGQARGAAPEAPRAPEVPPASRARGPALSALRGAGDLLVRLPRGLSWVPVLCWMGLIWWLSSLPATEFPEVSLLGSFVTNLGHALVFGLLALWLVLLLPREEGWPRLQARQRAAVMLFVLVYGVIDELHQGYTPGRNPSPYDVLTDVVGAACVVWIAGYVRSGSASERGLWARLAAGVAFCVGAAVLATFEPF